MRLPGRVSLRLMSARPFGTPSKLKKKPPRMRRDAGSYGANSLIGGAAQSGLLDDVPVTLPDLTRAVKLQAKAATVGFDWNDARLVLERIREETGEIAAALDASDRHAADEEIGDLLFAAANLARHLQSDPEAAIRGANAKFESRFRFIENELARQGKTTADAGLMKGHQRTQSSPKFRPASTIRLGLPALHCPHQKESGACLGRKKLPPHPLGPFRAYPYAQLKPSVAHHGLAQDFGIFI
jgi:phosphoribosyl-ATP pyrophosphohydrolase